MDKRRLPFDLVHRKGPETTLHGVLIVVASGITGGQKVNSEILTCRNQRCFCLCTNNHWSYRQMEAIVGFSVSKRSINALPRNPNGSCRVQYRWKRTCRRNLKIGNLRMFFPAKQQPERLWTNGDDGWIQRIK